VAQLVAGDEAGEVGGDGAVAAGWEEVTGRLTSQLTILKICFGF
jgi:hypothetical protein